MGFSRQENGVGCNTLLQGIFLTQGLNLRLLCLLHWQIEFFTTHATWEAPLSEVTLDNKRAVAQFQGQGKGQV